MAICFPSEDGSFSNYYYVILLPVLFLLLAGFVRWLSLRTYRTDPLIKKPRTIHFYEKGINCTTPNNNMSVEWNDITFFIERNKSFYFMLGFTQAFILPAHVFTSEQEYMEFRDFIGSVIGSKKKKTISVIPVKFRVALYLVIFAAVAVMIYFDIGYTSSFDKALKEYDKKNFKAAVELFNVHAQETGQENTSLLKYRAYSYYGMENFEAAKKDFLKYVSKNKANGEVYLFLGLSCVQLNDTASGCFYFTKSDSLKYADAKKCIERYCGQ
jgi:tetratricopeptide (TPR) repeat protein